MRISHVVVLLVLSLLFVTVAGESEVAEAVSEEVEVDSAETKVEETKEEPPADASGTNGTDAVADEAVTEEPDTGGNETQAADEVESGGNATQASNSTDDTVDSAKDEGSSETPENTQDSAANETKEEPPAQTGPFIDLLGPTLLSLQMVDESRAQLHPHSTNDALKGKAVVGLYFSADWCGPCRQFTPDLVSFYNKMNSRRGKENQFEIVWVSRCRDLDSFGQYFTHMNWLALPPELAMGQHGQMLFQKYKAKGIPTLVLLDEAANVITTDARNKIPQDKAGVGFPWRNPLVTLYMTVLPKSLRYIVKSQVVMVKDKLLGTIKGVFGMKAAA